MGKAFDVLRAFGPTNRVMTLTELAAVAGLPKSTVHRLLARLIDLDAVERTDAGYKVSVSLARIASASPANLMREEALPHMVRLHHWSKHTIVLGVLRGLDVVILDQVGSFEWHSQPFREGARLPASRAAIGKVLLAWDPPELLEAMLPDPLPQFTPDTITDRRAFLDQLGRIRAENTAQQVDEVRDGVAGVASAIVVQGKAVGALGLVHPSDVALPPQAIEAVRRTAAHLSQQIRSRLESVGQEKRWMPSRELAAPPDSGQNDLPDLT